MKSNALLACTLLLFLLSCTRDVDIVYPDPLFPENNPFKATLFIRVLSEWGEPVPGARVTLGPLVKESDFHGWIKWQDAPVTSSVYLKVEKKDFFNGSRRFQPSPNSNNYVEIRLLHKNKTASLAAKDGKSILVEGNYILNFPKNAYQFENGDSYDGEVNVYAHALSIDDPDMSFKMPGNLTGLNKDNDLKQLASLGMITVELESSDGQKLMIKEGQQVEIRMPVEEKRRDLVPPTVPMWHFDEQLGVWKEEGVAELDGDYYVANVNHFSFWNCDDNFELVQWKANVHDQDGQPLGYGKVCLTIDALNTRVCEYLDQDGKISGGVAANEVMTFEVFSSCGQSLWYQKIGPYEEDQEGTSFVVELPDDTSRISGNIYNCDHLPISNGYVMINNGIRVYKVPVDSSGLFMIKMVNCGHVPVSIQAFHSGHLSVSSVISYDWSPTIIIDSISACIQQDEYFLLDAEGLYRPYFIVPPHVYIGELIEACDFGISAEEEGLVFGMCLKDLRPGFYPNTHCYLYMNIYHLSDTVITIESNTIDLKIEQIDRLGTFVKATFQGELQPEQGNRPVPPVSFKGEFRLRRNE